jgi:hypothetical protein
MKTAWSQSPGPNDVEDETMKRRAGFGMNAVWLFMIASCGCNSATELARVQFASAPTMGRWDAVEQAGATPPAVPVTMGGVGVAGSASGPTSGVAGIAAPGGPPGVLGPQAGAFSMNPAGRAGAAANGGMGGGAAGPGGAAGSGSAGSAGAAGSTSPTGTVASLSFDVMTAPQGGLYQPRNIGAIWIQDSTGRFMKSLEVWAGIRSRYLSKYAAARGSMAVDVTASATLSSHRMHHATWNLKDRTGTAAPAGKYTLYIELTDTDWTGKFKSVDFDTSLGAQTLMPAGDSYYSAMKLTLQ